MMNRTIRCSFLSSLACGALLIAASASRAAETGSIETLQPSTGWAISRIAANTPNAAPYCAMARKFSDNMILTFARNNKSEISVAVDFQRDVLSAGQTYFTVLKPGYSQDRAFNVRPVSAKALVIRMGMDQDFFDALTRSEHLSIDLDGEQYSFVMPEMESGLRDMQDCLTSTARVTSANPSLPNEAPQTATASSAAEAPTASNVQARVESKNAARDSAPPQGAPTALAPVLLAPVTSQSMSTVQPGAGEPGPGDAPTPPPPETRPRGFLSPDPLAASAPRPSISRADGDDPQWRAAQAQAAFRQSRGQTDIASAPPPIAAPPIAPIVMRDDSGKLAQLSARVADLEKQNDSLRAQLAQSVAQADASGRVAEQARSGMAQQIRQLTALKTENAGLESHLASLQAQRAATPQANARVAQLEIENKRLTMALAQAQMDPGGAPTERADAVRPGDNAQVASLAAERDQLRKSLADARMQIAQLQRQAAAPRDVARNAVQDDAGAMAQLPPASGDPMPIFTDRAPAPASPVLADGKSVIAAMLDKAGLHPDGGIAVFPSADGQALTWKIHGLAGSALRQPFGAQDDFTSDVEAYVSQTGKRCAGQFAGEPGPLHRENGATSQTYEIACVGPRNGSSQGGGLGASLLFTMRDGVFTAIAHEGKIEAMEQAMNIRDRLAFLTGDSKLASR